MAREGNSTVVHRSDYSPTPFWVEDVRLTFDLDESKTRVLNVMRIRRNPDLPAQALRLDGEELNLARVMVNGQGTSFRMDNNQLVLENLPEGHEAFELEIFTTCNPSKNTQLNGLYVSQGSFFTQCEAQGFRRITYFLDRPDVMATYTVTLRADKRRFPVLLSNGNLLEQSDLPDGRHQAVWHDPFKKPCYLFALVAGTFVCREQRIVDGSGQSRLLQVHVRSGDLDKTEHAMKSLMASIAWDETRFGLPLDLDRFMIVATSDFNMGAMENKGLNIFNTKYVLASPATATDSDYAHIDRRRGDALKCPMGLSFSQHAQLGGHHLMAVLVQQTQKHGDHKGLVRSGSGHGPHVLAGMDVQALRWRVVMGLQFQHRCSGL